MALTTDEESAYQAMPAESQPVTVRTISKESVSDRVVDTFDYVRELVWKTGNRFQKARHTAKSMKEKKRMDAVQELLELQSDIAECLKEGKTIPARKKDEFIRGLEAMHENLKRNHDLREDAFADRKDHLIKAVEEWQKWKEASPVHDSQADRQFAITIRTVLDENDTSYENEDHLLEMFRSQVEALSALAAPDEAAELRFDSQGQRIYYASLRYRNIYFLAAAMVLTVAFMAGVLMQFFFELFLSRGEASYRSEWGTFLLFPLWLVMFAILGDELTDLVSGALEEPSAPRARAYMLVASHYILGKKIHEESCDLDKGLCTVNDLWWSYILDGSMFFGGLMGLLLFGTFWSGFITGGIIWGFSTSVLFIVSDLFNNALVLFDADEALGISQAQHVASVMAEIFHDDQVLPGRSRQEYYSVTFSQGCQERAKRRNDVQQMERRRSLEGGAAAAGVGQLTVHVDELKTVGRKAARRIRLMFVVDCVMSALIWIPYIIITFLFVPPGAAWSFPLTGVVLAISTWFLSRGMQNAFPQLVGDAYVVFMVIISVLTVLLFMSGAAITTQASNDRGDGPFMVIPSSPTNLLAEFSSMSQAFVGLDAELGAGDLPRRWLNRNTTRYPVCNMAFGSTSVCQNGGLNVLDLAALAGYAYTADKETFLNQTMLSFDGAQGLTGKAELVHWTDYSAIPRFVAVRFPTCDKDTDVSDTIVVSVKGTSTTKDGLTDSSLYAMITVLQAFDMWVPVLSLVPTGLTAWLLSILRLKFTEEEENNIFNSVIEQVNQLREKYPAAKFVITGHSLGGGIAETVGTRLALPTVVFSAPGMLYSRLRFGADQEKTNRAVVGIVPETDVVPKVDLHHDMVQHIACRNEEGLQRPFLDCHFIKVTLCELWRACGDSRERDFTGLCKDYVDKRWLGKFFKDEV